MTGHQDVIAIRHGAISGGYGNQMTATPASVSGGYGDTASTSEPTVGAGVTALAQHVFASIFSIIFSIHTERALTLTCAHLELISAGGASFWVYPCRMA